MQKIAIIPSKTENIPLHLSEYFKDAGWKVAVMAGCESIFEAYDSAITKHNIKSNDTVILCHDDISVLTNKSVFNEIIEENLKENNVGFLGIAGTRILRESCVWWEGLGDYATGHLAGMVYHGTSHTNMQETYYGPTGEVVVMDGVFLVCKGRTLFNINTKKPSYFSGNWDFYDISYTLQAHFKGFKNKVVPIQIFHKSMGDTSNKASWHVNRQALIDRLGDKLPVFIKNS
jgi:hypothetical protein